MLRSLKRNGRPGGKISQLVKDGFIFDSGPSLFTEPENIEELFSLAGEPIEEYLRYKKLPQSCRYFFENGKLVNAYSDRLAFSREMETVLGEDAESILKYLAHAEDAYKNIGNIFLDHSLHKLSTWIDKGIVSALAFTRIRYLTETLHEYNQKYFRSEEAVQIFDRFATYNGSNPFTAPAMLSMIPHLEQNEGSYYPEGGMNSIQSALHALATKKVFSFISILR
jgi:phytoene dehydrogenase-like protein